VKILVNAIACRVAGGRAVALNFLRSYRDGDFPHNLVVWAPGGCGYEELAGGRIEIRIAPAIANAAWARPWVDNILSRRLLEQERPDVLFAMGSIAYPTEMPQLVLFHWPYAVYPEDDVWTRMASAERTSRKVRRWLFGRRRRFASRFAAQTETARARLEEQWGLTNVSVVPNAVSVVEGRGGGEPRCLPPGIIRDGRRALLCLTRYYPHKNVEILLDVARGIRDAGLPLVVLLTLSRDDGQAAAALLDSIEREGLSQVLVNLGTVPMEEVPALYAACDGLLLPTLLESFSGTYVESMHHERAVFTSDRDFARDVCGGAAWYFDPHDAENILDVVQEAFANPDEMRRRLAEGRKRCSELPSWPEVTERYVRLLEEVSKPA
jgi:glycosyltransferase involved in cell wall biosynthesis